MIKIIKEGRKVVKCKPIYIVTCKYCDCEFECETSDFNVYSKRLEFGQGQLECPNCSMNIIVDTRTCKQRLEVIK